MMPAALRQRVPRPKTVCDVCLLRVVAAGDDPVTSTTEVVEHTPLSREGARQRLLGLADLDLIAQTEKGKTALWYPTLAGHRGTKSRCDCGRELP